MDSKEERRQSTLERALKYYELGFSVIPLQSRSKKPMEEWKKYQTERAEPDKIRSWFEKWPDMNIGIVTGAISGIVVVDVEAEGDAEQFPTTVMSETGGGGYHLFYKHPGGHVPNATKIVPHVDIRGDGGYVVAPPSVSEKGAYEWVFWPEDSAFTEYPPVLLYKQQEQKNAQISTTGKVPVGERNVTATRFIGAALKHVNEDAWATEGWELLKEWNETQTEKPLDEDELRSIFDSIAGRERKSPNTSATRSFKTETLADLYGVQFPKARWLVENLIPLGGLVAVTGEPASFKSFLTQSLAASVATNTPFVGKFPVHKGKVLVVDEENQRSQIRERFEAMGITATPDILFVAGAGIKFDNEQDVKRLIEIVERERPTLVVLDSLVRFHAGDENSAKDMSALLGVLKKLVGDERTVVFIHHHRKNTGFSGKSAGVNIRGSSDILAAVDCHVAVERKGRDIIAVTQNKLRMQKELGRFRVAIVSDENGTVQFSYQGEDNSANEELLQLQEDIKEMLTKSGGPLAVKELAKTTSASPSKVRKAIKELVDGKEVIETKGAHNTSFYGLVVPEEQESPESGVDDGMHDAEDYQESDQPSL